MPDKEKIEKHLNVAKQAALRAGDFLMKRDKSNLKINKETGHDIKIAADVNSERIIIDYLKDNSHIPILSEEAGMIKRGDEEGLMWVVDPLDGSLNYMRGLPLCCVSVGLWEGEKPLLGAVYDFIRSEMFTGIADKGAHLNDSVLTVSEIDKKEKAVLCTGFPVNTSYAPEKMKTFADNARAYKKLRLLGSAALSIAYVAGGRADAYYEEDIMLWDIAGAIPVLLGAGGKLNIKKADKKYSYNVFAYNGKIQDE